MHGITSFLTELAIDINKMDAYVEDSNLAYKEAGLTKGEIALLESKNARHIYDELYAAGAIDEVARTTTRQTSGGDTNVVRLARLSERS